VRPDLVGAQAVDVGFAAANQLGGALVQPLEVVGRVVQRVPPEPEPLDVLLDGVDVFDVLLGRVGVVEAQVAGAAGFPGDSEVQADRLGVADVQVAVRLGREPRRHAPAVLSGAAVLGHDRADEVSGCG
jgi:hypothetical protein